MNSGFQPGEDQDKRFLKVCSLLNEAGVKYAVCGGYACILHGSLRATQDVDILVEKSDGNLASVITALSKLEDGAASELTLQDLKDNKVVKVADEIVVDVSTLAWTVTYDEAAANIRSEVVDGVAIPFLGLRDLIKSKQTYRDQDRLDIETLVRYSPEARELLQEQQSAKTGCLFGWW